MLANPKPGTRVVLWYARRPGFEHLTPWHGCTGVVVHAGRGRPRNHTVRLDNGRMVGVPAGNLRKEGNHAVAVDSAALGTAAG